MTDRLRKSLEQLKREARQGEGADPWACRVCGCRATEVVDSRQHGVGPRVRQRRCLHCKEPLTTQEVPVPPGFKIVVVSEEEPAEEDDRACA